MLDKETYGNGLAPITPPFEYPHRHYQNPAELRHNFLTRRAKNLL